MITKLRISRFPFKAWKMDPDFDMKRSLVDYIKQNNFLPKLESEQVSQEKLIHHVIEIDTIKILEYERKYNFSIFEIVVKIWHWLLYDIYFTAILCDFILEDGDQGAWLFQQIIEDELRQLYNRHLRVSISKRISRQIISKMAV